ncbi:MAG: transcriptional regulator, Fis family [Phycisphaerales bacterium]|nr:transcriptional regulator, Fis family [Phycisphaerales bacterium]
MIAKKWVVCAAACLGGGCAVGPNYEQPGTQMPAEFSAPQPTTQPSATQPSTTQPSANIGRWWETFNDPVLDSLIDRAVKSNLDLRVAQSRVRESRFSTDIQRAGLFPVANADASYTRERLSKTGFFLGGTQPPVDVSPGATGVPNTGGPATVTRSAGKAAAGGTSAGAANSSVLSQLSKTEFDVFQGGFDASWEIDVFGGVRRSIEAARADEQAAVEARRDTMVSLLAEVARNYIQLRGVQRELDIAADNIRSQQDTVDLTKSRFNAGLATDLDVARAEAQVATTRATVPGLQTTAQQSIHRLGVLLGQQPTALMEELSKASPIPPPPPTVPVGLPSQLLRRRPDVRRAERQLAAATARVGVATADLFPRFSLTGSLGLAAGQFKQLGRLDSVFYTIGPSVSWPIFDAGKIVANIHVQNEREGQYLAQYQATVLVSLEDVENALVGYSQEQARREQLQLAVDANRRAVDLANQLYTKGLTDFLNVLDAQRNLYASQDALVQSEQSVSSDIVALYKALGGGWEAEEQAAQQTDVAAAQPQKGMRP